MEYREFLERVLKEVSGIANEKFGKVSGTTKAGDNNQVLTEADLEIGKYIISEIEKEFPTHNIIDEEAGVIDKKSDFTWVVDPIDGTSNFANGVPLYGIYLGLLKEDKPIAGGIALPYFNEIYSAEKGSGAMRNGNQVHTTKEEDLKNVLVAYGIDGHPEESDFVEKEGRLMMNIVLGIRNLRTSNSPFDGAMVARGDYGAWLCRSSKIWDNVALQVVLEEAGATYTDFYGKEIDYSNPLGKTKENFTYCAASPKIHKQLQEIIHSA